MLNMLEISALKEILLKKKKKGNPIICNMNLDVMLNEIPITKDKVHDHIIIETK